MPRNGSGVYGPPAGTAAVPNTPIESAKYNSFVNDISEAITNSVNVNGTAPFQAHQAMGGFKLTNLGAGSAAGDGINLGQAQSNIIAHAASVGGTADAITATFSPAFTAWTAKMRFRFTTGGANTVVDPTINVDGLGIKTIKKWNGQALRLGEISGAGHVCECVYDGTDVILLNPAGRYETLTIAVSDETTSITAGVAKVTFRLKACTVQAVRSSLSTASSAGSPTVDINEGGTSILGANKLSIDATEKTSVIAATATSIADGSIAEDAEMTIDIDVAGTGAKGLKVYLDLRYAA
jgi:hypothetical protein